MNCEYFSKISALDNFKLTKPKRKITTIYFFTTNSTFFKKFVYLRLWFCANELKTKLPPSPFEAKFQGPVSQGSHIISMSTFSSLK